MPGSKRKKIAETDPEDIQVRLKAILGIKPGLYLTVLYSLIIFFVLFMLLFFKGFRDQGTYIQFESTPSPAAVYVDGSYAGSTPCEVLVRKGLRHIRVEKPYHQACDLSEEFKGRSKSLELICPCPMPMH